MLVAENPLFLVWRIEIYLRSAIMLSVYLYFANLDQYFSGVEIFFSSYPF
jgi:hypothetical protein